jgi:Mg2+-importing ATPase
MEFDASEHGLSSAEARQRLEEVGPNTPGRPRRTSGVLHVLALFGNPLVFILLFTSGISAFLGEALDAILIVVIVLVGVAINFVQTFQSQRAVERLRASVAATATVLRDGAWTEIARAEVVPGDVIRLTAGDLVPADARLLQARDLHVQQAALTGESLPVEKEATAEGATAITADARNLVFLGTSVISGTATAVVLKTGASTAFGDIAARLASRPPETEFDRGTRRFGYLILQTVLFLVLFVFAVSVASHRNPLQSLLFAIALAVGLTPEFLPMITAVTLARGAVRMAGRKVVVKHLSALQNLGSMDILCSDKTGTLTSGTMALGQYVDALGGPSTRTPLLAYLNSALETGIKSPLDTAILACAKRDISLYQKLDEVPFDFERRRLSIVVSRGEERLLIVKGAPEGVVPLCVAYEAGEQTRPLDDPARKACEATYQSFGVQGFRVLAVAYRSVPIQPAYRAAVERDLVLVGFVTFADPPLPEAAAVLRELRRDGVEVKIITGDSERVARHVCTQVALAGERIVLGSELDAMSDVALGHVAEQTNVFARVSPAQKNRIIAALKHRGHVVGFLGDGINDAPSLRAADVGISVATAVDVARDAADVILLERHLRVLHTGILEGRRAFGNVMKYLLMGTSSNFGNMFSMAAASVFLPFLPMLPSQVLLNNLMYDLAQVTIPTDRVDATFIHKPRRWDIGLVRNFMLVIGPSSSLFDFLTFFVLLKVFAASEAMFHTGWFVESLATQTLVLLVIRTAGNPLRSRPSRPLLVSVLAIVAAGVILPYTPLAAMLGFEPLPGSYLAFLVAVAASYLVLVDWVKRWLMRRLMG